MEWRDTKRFGPWLEAGERKPGESPALAMTPKLCNWRVNKFKRWAERPVQGAGVSLFKRDPKSNNWLKNLPLKGFTAWNFKTALKTRANVVPVKEALTQGRA